VSLVGDKVLRLNAALRGLFGDLLVGKSSLTVQFVEGHFIESYYPTIENTFRKTIKLKGFEYECEILDTAGQVWI
jgi:Ras homolog enriched in brain